MRSATLIVLMAALGCGDNLELEPVGDSTPCRGVALARGRDLQVEDVAADGAWIAYSSAGAVGRQLHVVAPCDGRPRVVGEGWARFERGVLLVFTPGDFPEAADRLSVWRPGMAEAQPVAFTADPDATSVSHDGRWLVTEADDRDGDHNFDVAITLVDLTTMQPRVVASLSTARARFTDDSRRLLFGGDTWPQPCRVLHQLDLATGALGDLGCYETRFEADDASAWVVRLERDGWLRRTNLATGAVQPIASGVAVTATKPFDVDPDSQAIAFVGDPSSGATAGIWTVPIAGGTPVRLGDGADLVGTFRDAVAYRGDGIPTPSTYAVAPSGGAPVSLWASTIIDVEAGLLLARTAGPTLQVLPLPPAGPGDVVPAVEHAAIIDATRLVVHAARALRRVDLDAAGHVIDDVVLRADVKSFVAHAGWYAAAVDRGEPDDALVIGAIGE